jgi:DNA-binding MarR family transcriptional regulator
MAKSTKIVPGVKKRAASRRSATSELRSSTSTTKKSAAQKNSAVLKMAPMPPPGIYEKEITPRQWEMITHMRQFMVETVLFNQKVAEIAGLHLTDMQCMNLLSMMGTTTPGKLAESTGLTTGGVTVMLDRLEKAGFIKREPNPQDRRSVLVHVHEKKMLKLSQQHYAGVKNQFHVVIAELAEDELRTVIRFFARMNTIHPVRLVR